MISFFNLRKSLLLLCCLPLAAQADVSDRFHFSGFASFIAAKSIDSDALYGDSTSRIPESLELRDYSKLGLRLTVDMHDKLELTAQMLAEGRNDFNPEFDWLFVSYHITPNLVAHIGKYVNPVYMYSDFIDVGYAYQWVNAPSVIYDTSINKTLEGGKLVWNSLMGNDWSSELSFLIGKDETDLDKVGVPGSSMKMNRAMGLVWQVNHDWLTLRAGYSFSKISANLIDNANMAKILSTKVGTDGGMYGNIAAILNGAGISSAKLHKTLNWSDDTAQAFTLGASMNFTHVFAQAEFIYSDMSSNITVGKQYAAYATIGTYLPHNTAIALTVYQKRNKPNEDIMDAFDQAAAQAYAVVGAPDTNPANPATQLAGLGQALDGTVDAIQKRVRTGLSLSARWDFHANAAFKAEYLYEWQTDYNGTRSLGGQDILGVQQKFNPQAIRVGVDLVF